MPPQPPTRTFPFDPAEILDTEEARAEYLSEMAAEGPGVLAHAEAVVERSRKLHPPR